ncbi:hypothetical protein ACNOYE_02710 [Nannocystaceae bacterium ST9]
MGVGSEFAARTTQTDRIDAIGRVDERTSASDDIRSSDATIDDDRCRSMTIDVDR